MRSSLPMLCVVVYCRCDIVGPSLVVESSREKDSALLDDDGVKINSPGLP